MSKKNLIERYVSEVGRNLPRRMRGDVELELRSLLADSLEEQYADDRDQVIIDLLQELGPPAEFAAQYLPEQKLIGPLLFPLFKLVLTIVLSVIGGLHLVLAVVGLLQGSVGTTFSEIAWWFSGRLFNFGESAIYVFGIITLVFILLEWLGVTDVAELHESWNPLDLPEVEDKNQLKPFELILGIVGAVLLIVAVNVFPNWIGLLDFAGEEWGIKVLWADGFYPHIPWLTALWIGEIIQKVYVLQQRRWRPITRGAELFLQLFAIYVLNRIISGPAVLVPEFFDSGLKGIILVVIVITAIDSAAKFYQLVTTLPIFTVQVKSNNSTKINNPSHF